MNNEMDDFTAKVGMPNADGLIQGESNGIDAGKRPLSSMTPTFLTKDGKLFLVIGSPGGPTIINTVLQVILNVIDFKMDIQAAVDEPRIHHQWMPDTLSLERNLVDLQPALEAMGHHVHFGGEQGVEGSVAVLVDGVAGIGGDREPEYSLYVPGQGHELATVVELARVHAAGA